MDSVQGIYESCPPQALTKRFYVCSKCGAHASGMRMRVLANGRQLQQHQLTLSAEQQRIASFSEKAAAAMGPGGTF